VTVLATLLLATVAAAVVAAYLAGARHLAGAPGGRRWAWTSWHWRRYAFCAGVVVTVVTLLPAFDARVDDSFVLHMTQHLVLMWVAAPLLALGCPSLAFLLALPRPWRRRVSAARAWPPVRTARALLMGPVIVAFLDAVVVMGWHLPVLYTAALHSDLLHVTEHAAFLLASWLMWSLLAAPRPRLEGGMAVLYVFLTGFPSVGVGAALVTAGRALYPAQTGTGAGAIAAQQTAGVLMWIPPTFLSLLLCAVLVLAWFRSMERAAPGGAPLPPPIPPLLTSSGEVRR
jgi:putative membrane protein